MNLVGLAGKSGFPENTAKYECRPKAASDYPEHISTKRQGFIRVYRASIAPFGTMEMDASIRLFTGEPERN
jgi:hypothetical protein